MGQRQASVGRVGSAAWWAAWAAEALGTEDGRALMRRALVGCLLMRRERAVCRGAGGGAVAGKLVDQRGAKLVNRVAGNHWLVSSIVKRLDGPGADPSVVVAQVAEVDVAGAREDYWPEMVGELSGEQCLILTLMGVEAVRGRVEVQRVMDVPEHCVRAFMMSQGGRVFVPGIGDLAAWADECGIGKDGWVVDLEMVF